ncbi:MAG: cysteine desulfurase family protein [Pseudomonadota bacterium]
MMTPIYLDYNATTPIDREVAEEMIPFLRDQLGNPSSSHAQGRAAREAVERARAQVADFLGCRPGEVVFTSGGTESNNYAIKGAVLAHRHRGGHLITSAVEHPAVTEVCGYLAGGGFQVTTLPVDGDGLLDPEQVREAIKPGTILISVMHANNEVGTIEPVERIAKIAGERGVLFHTDAAQSAGKIPVSVDELGVDLLSLAGHKLYAPKGIGALYIRGGTELEKLMHGAGHEEGRRAGTENVPFIVAFGKACEVAKRDLAKNRAHMQAMRDRLLGWLEQALDGIRLNGHPTERLPNTLSVGFGNVEADALLAALEGVAASAGAACHAGGPALVSSVLKAMKVPPGYAMGTVRFSTGRGTAQQEIDRAAAMIIDEVERLRQAP